MKPVAGEPSAGEPASAEPTPHSDRAERRAKRVPGKRSLPPPVRRAVAALTPPLLHNAGRRVWHGEWAPAWKTVKRWIPPTAGWDHESVSRAESAEWARHVQMNFPTGVLGAEDAARRVDLGELWRHNTLISHAYVLMLADREAGGGKLSILDWGGGVGQFHLTAKTILPEVDLRYEVKDLPATCRVGRELQPDVVFHEDDECLRHRYDLVMAMGSLQYSQDWGAMLAALGEAAAPHLFISRLPTVFEHPSYLVRQRAYDTEYVGWMINRDEFLAAASREGLVLMREFLGGEAANVRGAPEQFEARAFLFRANGTVVRRR